ncbi:helix-turn-helix domain-containing protein [Streptomyces sp. NPDC093982]|uniref:helix-turn-helix domain-containing protein n=1 Tax=Streptomyces sp. NPDC093982 TaxID=3155077 RepID=UPI0034475669
MEFAAVSVASSMVIMLFQGGGVLVLSGRRYRLKLTAVQVALCGEFGNICRVVWDTGLEQRRLYRRRGVWMNYVPPGRRVG